MGMKQILVMMAAVVLVGCSKDTPEPSFVPEPVSPAEEKLIFEKAARQSLRVFYNLYPEGELTEADLAKITLLNLHGTKTTDALLKEVAKLQQLEQLWLEGTQITDEGLKEVAKLQNLIGLGLPPQITDEGLKEVAKLRNLTNLGFIDTKITDEGVKEVAKLRNLTYLNLSGTQIADANIAKLKKALPNCEIEGP